MRLGEMEPVFVVGAAAVSAVGFEWRGLGRAILSQRWLGPTTQLAQSHPGVLGAEVPAIPTAVDAGDARARKLMSRGARLGAIAVRSALTDADWTVHPDDNTAFYFGVGASGGGMAELTEMLRDSMVADRFSEARFGDRGLRACNPLFAFQLMNNFTLCHAAIFNALSGPNGAFFSRGNGTVAALVEAAQTIMDGSCDRALAGGADSALHPVTWAELVREGHAARGLVPAEGAAVLALARRATRPFAILEHCEVRAAGPSVETQTREILDALGPVPIDLVVIAPASADARAELGRALAGRALVDTSESIGEALAAAPALAWVVGLDLLLVRRAERALILNAGTDGGVGAVLLRRAR